jgi:endoglucanase
LNKRLSALVMAVTFLLLLPAAALAQFPSPTYGWNLGNTLEPPCGEGCWAPAATQSMINAVADAGFNTIRIPVAWDSHANQSTYVISSSWLNRVKQVVDWSLDAGLTVLVNDHWDGGWLENNIGSSVDPTIDAKMDAYWTQIATTFVGASYDERLLFAGTNEPNVDNPAEMATLLHYEQTFVDAVRDVGGSNTSRWLVVQGPNTDINRTDMWMNTLPTDSTADRLAVEVHYYDPWQFAGLGEDADWGDMFYFWGEDYHTDPNGPLGGRNATHSEEDHLVAQLQKMNTKFVSQGIPVILGEFGATDRRGNPELSDPNDLDLHLASRLYYHQLIVDTANSLGIAPFYWDNSDINMYNGQGSGIFDRNTATVFDQDAVDVLTGGPGQPGDFDGDLDVDGDDFLLWQRDPGVGSLADWETYYGTQPPPLSAASTSVPEPATTILTVLGAVLVASFRRNKGTQLLCR